MPGDLGPVDLRPPEQSGQGDLPIAGWLEQVLGLGDLGHLLLQALPTRRVDQAQALAQGRQPAIGVVVPQQQAVLGPAGEHAVRLVDAAGHQVVDHHADVGLVAAEHQRLAALRASARRWRRPSAPARPPPRSRSCR